jgi:hypothetical protein
MLHSIYDLTTFCRKTSGDVPAKLVVCSVGFGTCTQVHDFVHRERQLLLSAQKCTFLSVYRFPCSALESNLTYTGREAGNGTQDGIGPLHV